MTHFDKLIQTYPSLTPCRADFETAFNRLRDTYRQGGRVYVCGNGGSEADAQHIVGELMKGFEKKRPVRFPDTVRSRLTPGTAQFLEDTLQGALPCHSLSGETALMSALLNDLNPDVLYAQQLYGYGRPGDAFLGISTSGNAVNVCLAAELAQGLGLHTLGLTGGEGGRLASLCDVTIRVPAQRTAEVQELHLPVYHALCRALEDFFFQE